MQPRAIGALRLSAKRRDGRSVLDRLWQSGSLKALFPRPDDMLQAIVVNTGGGVTGGDVLSVYATAGPDAALSLTTQAAERAYRAADATPGRLDVRLAAGPGAALHWLPQETILYDGSALDRRIAVDLAADARLLFVEPLVFGRAAMGERLRAARFRDRIAITRAGRPAYLDGVALSGDIAARLAHPAVAAGAGAMASLVYVAPDASTHLDPVRRALPATGGASLLAPDLLALRLLAADSQGLRRVLVPVLDRLSGDRLPPSWRL